MECTGCKYFKFYEEKNRATGRTFRLILKALHDASEGKKVTFFAHNVHYAKDLYKKSYQLLDSWISIDVLTFYSVERVIEFPNGGCLQFLSIKEYDKLREQKYDEFIYDHFIMPCYELDRIQQFERDTILDKKVKEVKDKFTFKEFNFKIY